MKYYVFSDIIVLNLVAIGRQSLEQLSIEGRGYNFEMVVAKTRFYVQFDSGFCYPHRPRCI